jgi:phage shock protein A
MEQADELGAMDAAAAKEYIFHYITTLKLTEMEYQAQTAEYDRWLKRAELARTKGAEDLLQSAQGTADLIKIRVEELEGEIRELRDRVRAMRQRLPAQAAQERRVDADLLEQELRMVLGDEEPASKTSRSFEALEADQALETLKAKMGLAADPVSDTGEPASEPQ